VWWDLAPSFGGGYTTDTLMSLEAQLRALRVPRHVLRDVYAPFIIEGPSQFSDTWGAIRQHVGDKLRPHLGQDVFCEADAPVLAAEPGVVEFGTDRLGGTIVRLHRDDGGYWYYAHLSRYASGLSSGDRVETGDVVGHCGTTGNAAGGSPHVHFGSYPGPENPMDDLISWLDTAEREAQLAIDRAVRRHGDNVPVEAAAFGTSIEVLAAERCPVGEESADPLTLLLAES
jgi:murein DD-endopeptidase MepM/ murein hydrolase activator NlpD